MMDITRYGLSDGDEEVVEDPSGDFVLYDDYEELLKCYKKLCKMITEIYIETP